MLLWWLSIGIIAGAQDGFMRDDEDHHENDAYPDGPLPVASLRSRTSRHTRVREIDLKQHKMNYKMYQKWFLLTW